MTPPFITPAQHTSLTDLLTLACRFLEIGFLDDAARFARSILRQDPQHHDAKLCLLAIQSQQAATPSYTETLYTPRPQPMQQAQQASWPAYSPPSSPSLPALHSAQALTLAPPTPPAPTRPLPPTHPQASPSFRLLPVKKRPHARPAKYRAFAFPHTQDKRS